MKKRLLITTGIYPPDIGGPATYAQLLARRCATEIESTVITYSSRWSEPTDAQEPFRIIRVWKKWPRPIRHTLYFFKNFFAFRKVDLAYSLSTLNGGLTLWFWSRILRKPYAIRVVGDWAWEYAASHGKTSLLIGDFQVARKKGWIAILARLRAFVAKKAHMVIVPSQYLATMVKGWGVAESAIHVIANSTEIPDALPAQEVARKKLAIPGRVVLSAGRLVPWKGFRLLIKLMPKLLELDPFFRLVIVGDGPDQATLATYVKNLRLENKVLLVGKKSKDELKMYFAAADLFVLNTGYEGFSHLIIEAMAHKVPVITTSIPGNQEIIEQGENGFLVKYNDEFNFFEAIQTVWKDEKLRDKFRKKGFATAQHFTVDRMIDEVKRVLFSLS